MPIIETKQLSKYYGNVRGIDQVDLNVKAGEFYNKYSLGELYFILRNLNDKISYKKVSDELISRRNKK